MRVSVIIPTYNCGQWLAGALASVLDQQFEDFELLVVDDGSTDETPERVAALADPRVRYYHKPNGGVSSARNVGLDHARGQYIAWLDADDLWPPEFLAVMVSQLDRMSEYGAAYSSMVNVYPDGRRRALRRDRFRTSGRIAGDYFRWGFAYIITMLVRREPMMAVRFDESLRTNGDTDAILRLSRRVNFLSVPGVQVIRRVRPGSLSQHLSHDRLDTNKVRVLERFYFQLGGRQDVARRPAMKCLGKACCASAAGFYRFGAWKAARRLFARAIAYDPFSFKAYWGLARALLKGGRGDVMPDWQEPPPLPPEPVFPPVEDPACASPPAGL